MKLFPFSPEETNAILATLPSYYFGIKDGMPADLEARIASLFETTFKESVTSDEFRVKPVEGGFAHHLLNGCYFGFVWVAKTKNLNYSHMKKLTEPYRWAFVFPVSNMGIAHASLTYHNERFRERLDAITPVEWRETQRMPKGLMRIYCSFYRMAHYEYLASHAGDARWKKAWMKNIPPNRRYNARWSSGAVLMGGFLKSGAPFPSPSGKSPLCLLTMMGSRL